MCSNDVLNNELQNMKEQNKKEHTQVFSLLEKIDDKLDKLPEKFVTRMEFKAAM